MENLFQNFLLEQKNPPFSFFIKVFPNAPKTEIKECIEDGTWKIFVHAPAEKGKANQELLKFFKKNFGIHADIKTGKADRKKRVLVISLFKKNNEN